MRYQNRLVDESGRKSTWTDAPAPIKELMALLDERLRWSSKNTVTLNGVENTHTEWRAIPSVHSCPTCTCKSD